jgi:hypothetical protein
MPTGDKAVLTDCIRDPRTGTVHKIGEQVTVIRPVDQLGEKRLQIQWPSGGSCIVKPEEVKKAE